MSNVKTQIIITMAGFGQRFRDAGYDVPKYRIAVHDHTLLHWSLLSLKNFIAAGSKVVFIARAADNARDFIAGEMPGLCINDWSLVELPAPTDGQATTALKALPAIAADQPFLVYNIDTFVNPAALPAAGPRGDGWVPCFPGAGAAWSFARATAGDTRIIEIREKKRISEDATIGLYWFRSGALYADLYRRFYASSERMEAGERYIAPMYNLLIEDGGAAHLHRVPLNAVYPLGIPADVEAFAKGPNPLSQLS